MTVRVASGKAERWTGLRSVWIEGRGSGGGPALYDVESARAYRDRLVVKLRGVDDPTAAERLRGAIVAAPEDQIPDLPDGVYYVARLVGLKVRDEEGRALGIVRDVLPTGGVDVLEVEEEDGKELLVPLAREIVLEVSQEEGFLTVRLPEGLREGGAD